MKYFTVLAAVLVMSEVCTAVDRFMNALIECGTDIGMSHEESTSFAETDDLRVDCLDACALKKLGGMSSKTIDEQKVLQLINEDENNLPDADKLRRNLEKCHNAVKDEQNLSECEIAGKFVRCMKTGDVDAN